MSSVFGDIRPHSRIFAVLEGNRGARIRTGDLADPNGARYQAAPRPDAGRSIPHRYRPRSMPTRLADIVQELEGLLRPERFDDYCPNGLQVPGCELVETVASGESDTGSRPSSAS